MACRSLLSRVPGFLEQDGSVLVRLSFFLELLFFIGIDILRLPDWILSNHFTWRFSLVWRYTAILYPVREVSPPPSIEEGKLYSIGESE
jgi:hypothetical protein